MGNTGTGEPSGEGIHLHFEVKLRNALGNLGDDGLCWGYTPETDKIDGIRDEPNWFGYVNPYPYLEYDINAIRRIPIEVDNDQPVRTGPGMDYTKTFATVIASQKFVAFGEYNGWYQVYLPSKDGPATGWIQGKEIESLDLLLEVNDPSSEPPGVSVRANPTTSSDIISYVWDGQWFVMSDIAPSGSGCSKPWYEIYLPYGFLYPSGWVCGQYLLRVDLDRDGEVDVVDLGILLSNWGSTSKPLADINQDGRVDVVDLGILLSNWGK